MPIGRWIGRVVLIGAVAPVWGCAHGPRNFRKVNSPVPLVRARAVGLGRRQPGSEVLPVLVDRLADADPVVRLAAHEELRRRTGRDFGYVPWAGPAERTVAIDRWRTWIRHGDGPGEQLQPPTSAPVPPVKSLPVSTSQMSTS